MYCTVKSSLEQRSLYRYEPEKLIHLFSTDTSLVVAALVGAFILVLIVVVVLLIEVIVVVAEGTLQRRGLFQRIRILLLGWWRSFWRRNCRDGPKKIVSLS